MTDIGRLFRPEIRDLHPYRAADYAEGLVRLNANETPWRSAGDCSRSGLNRYPDVVPSLLAARLATRYGVDPERLLVTRGSTEGIEILIRALCRAGLDDIVICPPTFGMYAHYAQLQGAGIVEVPLTADAGFSLNVDGILDAWTQRCKLLFLCSPNNPTGNQMPEAQLNELCAALSGRGLVALDGAYLEFAADDPTSRLLERFDNVVVLRTLSKALGLAGARCGALLGARASVELLAPLLPPYCLSTPCQEAVLAALETGASQESQARLELLVAERQRMAANLSRNPRIRRVWPSDANFMLVESLESQALVSDAKAAGILIRDFSWDRWTPNCVRITVGTPEQNDRLLEALR